MNKITPHQRKIYQSEEDPQRGNSSETGEGLLQGENPHPLEVDLEGLLQGENPHPLEVDLELLLLAGAGDNVSMMRTMKQSQNL